MPVKAGFFVGLATFLVGLGAGLLAYSPSPAADTAVVATLDIPIRRGPGLDYKIVAFLKAGDQVETLGEEEAGWARIRTARIQSGWVLKRFLTASAPEARPESDPAAEAARLTRLAADLEKRRLGLAEENRRLKDFLDQPLPVVQSPKAKSREELQQGLTMAEELKKQHLAEAETLAKEIWLEPELLWWFLAGAGLCAGGALTGALTARIFSRL